MPLPPPTPAIAGLTAYKVPRHPAPIDLRLDGNEGPPAPAGLLQALSSMDPEDVVRPYPDKGKLRALLAGRLGIDPSRCIITAGGDDALDRAVRSLVCAGRELVLPSPTFEMIRRYATWAGGEVVEVDWSTGPYPTQAVLDAVTERTTAIAVVSPNNPTGAIISAEDLQRLSAEAPHAVLLVDLAYTEFADLDLTPVALALPNAVVFRTLSKAWGLAGLRVGYAAGPEKLIGWMAAAGNPYTVSGPSVVLALHRVTHGAEAVQAFATRVRHDRARIRAALADLGIDTPDSQGNFVFLRTPQAGWLRDALAGLGIGVRAWPGHPGLGDALRITCPGDVEATTRLVAALRTALAPEALILDMDGVLADVSGSYRTAIVATAAHFGVSVSAHDIHAAKAAGNANNDWVVTWRMVTAAGVDASQDAVTRVFQRIYLGDDTTGGLIHNERLLVASEVLEGWAKRGPIAIVTGRPRADALVFLERYGLLPSITAMVCMEDAPAKPSPAPVRLALEHLGVSHAWMVGDTVDDIVASRAAGVVPLGVVAPGESAESAEQVLTGAGAARVLAFTSALEELWT